MHAHCTYITYVTRCKVEDTAAPRLQFRQKRKLSFLGETGDSLMEISIVCSHLLAFFLFFT